MSKTKRKHESDFEESSSEEESSDHEGNTDLDDDSSEDEEVDKKTQPSKSRAKRTKVTRSKRSKSPDSDSSSEDEGECPNYKAWGKSPRSDGLKWKTLKHNGPVFAPPYERLPKNVHFRYNGKVFKLSDAAEEVAGFYARFLGHKYTEEDKFNDNFFKDWRSVMKGDERKMIKELKKCDFDEIHEYFKEKAEDKKEISKEEKLKIKKQKEKIENKYGYCLVDGHKEKIGNFYVEPPGLFRGRGDHPKMGTLKKRVQPEEVTINCGKNDKAPVPPKGRQWKEVIHDQTVSWLACWTENIQKQVKYIMLNQASGLKGEKDFRKYEKARELANHISRIRRNYEAGWNSSDLRIKQCSVALFLIDKLALRAGNEKSEDTADTVGCCSLRVEHVKLHKTAKVVAFNFLGKDSIPYKNAVRVQTQVFRNMEQLVKSKRAGDDLFDRLNTTILNKHLSGLMKGLTAKVFRTYNASHTLQEELRKLTPKNGTEAQKLFAYNQANRAVAKLCNHQRAVPKTYEKSMKNLESKIKVKRLDISKAQREAKKLKKSRSKAYDKKMASLKALKTALAKLELTRTDKKEGKDIALGTSKLNYLDPRITVAWCDKWDIPLEKVYNKTQRAKFQWAVNMAGENFKFD